MKGDIIKRKRTLNLLYLISFIFSLHLAIPIYINSSFLNTFIGENFVGSIYVIGALLSMVIIIYLPRILNQLGVYKTSLYLISLEILVFLSLAYFKNSIFLVILFVLSLATGRLIGLIMDFFLESQSEDKETGGIRGIFLTLANLAFLISPLITGLILDNGNYWKIYLLSAIIIIPLLVILSIKFRNFRDPKYEKPSFWKTFRLVRGNKDIYRIFKINFLLRFFYAVMIIYTPIYMYQYIGFDWKSIGIIFTVMLLPFVLFQLPIGKIADKWLGEKELLTVGLIIMAIFTGILSFTTEPTLWLWALLLFGTRTGASIVDVMSDTHFFKKIGVNDSNIISLFRTVSPLSYILAPVVITILLQFIEYKYIFLVLGAFIFTGIIHSLGLKDSK